MVYSAGDGLPPTGCIIAVLHHCCGLTLASIHLLHYTYHDTIGLWMLVSGFVMSVAHCSKQRMSLSSLACISYVEGCMNVNNMFGKVAELYCMHLNRRLNKQINFYVTFSSI